MNTAIAKRTANGFIRLFLFLLLVGATLLQFRVALFEQSEFSEAKGDSSLNKYQSNPRLLTYHARQKHIFEADMDTADILFTQALLANGFYIPAWLGLAELKKDEGNKDGAVAILEYVDTLTGDIKRWRWDKALVAYQLNREDILAGDLSYIIREIPGKIRNDACRMAFSVWKTPELLKENIGIDNIPHLFRFAIREKRVDEAVALWPSIDVDGETIKDKDVYSYINLLIAKDKLTIAAEIWKQRYNPDGLLFNGAFENQPLQSAFGWRVSNQKGSSWRIDSGLHVHFNRKTNINYRHAYQIIPLQGGLKYNLKGRIKTAKLTTDQLPFLEIIGYKCKAPYTDTEMVEPDQSWTPFELLFDVPKECEAMLLRLRRRESTFFDNKLAGDIWFKEMGISVVQPGTTIFIRDQNVLQQ